MKILLDLWSSMAYKYKVYAGIGLAVIVILLFLSVRSCASKTINKVEVPEHEQDGIYFNDRLDYDSILKQLQDYTGISDKRS